MLFGSATSTKEATIGNIETVYFFLAGLFTLAAIIFGVSKLPRVTSDESLEKSPKAMRTLLVIGVVFLPVLFADWIKDHTGVAKSVVIYASLVIILSILFGSMLAASKNRSGWGAMQYPQLVLGMIAIFVYVGVEVTIDNNFGAFLKRPEFGGYDEKHNSHLIALYWGSLMIGRWTGAVSVFNLSKATRQLLIVLVPFFAFGIICLANYIKGNDISDFKWYWIMIIFLIAANLYSQEKPVKLLLSVAIMAAVFILISLFSTGMIANYCIIACGLCCSVMWPCIFALAVAGLGKYTSQGSAFLIMMILGGAIIPPSQGALIDLDLGTEVNGLTTGPWTHLSYIVPLVCFSYLAWHTLKSRSELRKQGIDFDKQIAGGH